MTKIRFWREMLSEIYATAFMVSVGICATGQYMLSNGTASSLWMVNLAWGFAITFAIYAAFNVSGGHINPSISIAQWWLKKLTFFELCGYFLAQIIGASIGSLIALAVYREAIGEWVLTQNATFATVDLKPFFVSMPAGHLTHWGGFLNELVGTSFLGMFIAMVSRENTPIPPKAVPLLFGLNAMMLGSSFGFNTGCPLNPAREVGPRIVAYLLGYADDIFSHDNFYLWTLVAGPLAGSLLGLLTRISFDICGLSLRKNEQ
ncbi:unnamed protein product, partial [Mesorhabditis spiculigera]